MDLRETPPRPFVRHPWETARLRFFTRLLANHHLLQQSMRVLDVGAGDAWFASQLLRQLGRDSCIACWDSGYEGAAPRAEPRLVFYCDPPPGPFQLALMLDVLEHVPDDAAFLRTVLSRVGDGGAVLVSVPAWGLLHSAHDRVLGQRRYDPATARQLLIAGGLQVIESGGLFHTLLAPRAAAAIAERIRGHRRSVPGELEWKWGSGLRRLACAVLATDIAVSRTAARYGLSLPGLSWWALCRKP